MNTLDLHGYRVHEAEPAVMQFIDRLYAAGEVCGRIIHGHGVIAGELSRWLHSYPFVVRIERDPTNSGVTVVWLQALVT